MFKMYIPSGTDDSLARQYQLNREQGDAIVQGLQSGKRLAYDTVAQKFVVLSNGSSDEKYTQDLQVLTGKVNEFIKRARGRGLSDDVIKNIEEAAHARSSELKQRASGIRGLFISQKELSIIDAKAALLDDMASTVDYWVMNYLDEFRLISGGRDAKPIEPRHRAWYLNQGIYLEYMATADKTTRQQLGLAMLHGYSKAATVREQDSKRLEIQTTPVLPEDYRYHRSSSNKLLESVNDAYAKKMGVDSSDLYLVSSPLVREVFAREMPIAKVNLDIGSVEEFEGMIEQFLNQASEGIVPERLALFDITRLMSAYEYSADNIYLIIKGLEVIAQERAQDYAQTHPEMTSFRIEVLLSKLQPYALLQHQGHHVLLTPLIFEHTSEKPWFIKKILTRTGFHLSPDQAKAAWLEIETPQQILQALGLPSTSLATRGTQVPEVCADFNAFLNQPILQKFKALSNAPDAPPYLQILPRATVGLLEGLAQHNVDQVFPAKGLGDVLQIAYFRIFNAMQEAILRKDDLTTFHNQIELIHQEIQTILIIVAPYGEEAFSKSVIANLARGVPPVIASGLPEPRVHLKPSSMHSVSSALASIEAQKGSNQLNVAVLKDSYFESGDLLGHSSVYKISTFNGDRKAFDTSPDLPLDVFICEFHHNISLNRQEYYPEQITDYVKAMVARNRVAKKFTVIIDTTLSLEQSDDIRLFLEDPKIKKLIDKGELNVVLVRSAQKFDMLGIDNYYGGISVAINNPDFFQKFNERMDNHADQLGGLSYQGLTHLQMHANSAIEAYRSSIMANTQALYRLMPPAMIYHSQSTNPIQISRIEDEQLGFLDIKFPGYPQVSQEFSPFFIRYVEKHRLPLSMRASFGFAATNCIKIPREDSWVMRITPGLESKDVMELYAQFFTQVQNIIDQTRRENPTKFSDVLDGLIAAQIQLL